MPALTRTARRALPPGVWPSPAAASLVTATRWASMVLERFRRGGRQVSVDSPPRGGDGEPYCSVLDAGGAAIKALVVDVSSRPPAVLGAAIKRTPSQVTPAFEGLVAAAEQALIAAEDAAGVVPRRAVLGVPAPVPAVGLGKITLHRARPAAPLTPEEVKRGLDQARSAALTAAHRVAEAEYAAPPVLDILSTDVRALAVDGRAVASSDDLVGMPGQNLDISLAVSLARRTDVQHLRRLAEALDLNIAGFVGMPAALAGTLRPAAGPASRAAIVDAGAGATTAILAGPDGPEGSISFPLGSADLEWQVRRELQLDPEGAYEAIRAHAAGAGHRGAGGSHASRVVRRLAVRHAELWSEALELALAALARGRELPAELWLCGGGARLPELRTALGKQGWGATLPFPCPPAVRLLTPAEVAGIEDQVSTIPALQAVPPLSLAAAAVTILRHSSLTP
ncbi:MAG TPA: hypothetical protein VHS99_07075 [Chloroflexota bacterium]|nr:hypothetical protein [Chloroflexota bacterium]